jgi:hypothetical protein
MLLGVTLVAELVLEGQTEITPLSIVLAEPGRCSLSGEKGPRLRRIGMQLLEALGVRKTLHPGSGHDDPHLLAQAAKLIECAANPVDGFMLHQLGIDIERLEDEGILTEGERITETVVGLDEGAPMTVRIERSTDANFVRYRDPLTGTDVHLPARHARRWKVELDWLREEIVTALGASFTGVRSPHFGEEPVYLGELSIDGQPVAVYFATKMSNGRRHAKVDAALRLRPRPTPGIVLTTTPTPFPFAGTNVVIPIDAVLAEGDGGHAIDLGRLHACYREGQLAAMGGTTVRLTRSADGQSAVLYLPGKAPWRVTGPAKIMVLERLVDVYRAGTPHVNTKKLMEGTGCSSPANLFGKSAPWRDYLMKVPHARAWQLKLSGLDDPVEAGLQPGGAETALPA